MRSAKAVPEGNAGQGRREEERDLGLGSKVAEESHERFLNKDGTFTVRREGLGFFRSLSLYHWLLTLSWSGYLLLLVGFYFLTNVVFAFGYYLCGPESFHGIEASSSHGWALDSFFFSIQTIATIGYGRINPVSLTANILVTIESLVGLLGLALGTGILFARFSRPSAKGPLQQECRHRAVPRDHGIRVPHCQRAEQPADRSEHQPDPESIRNGGWPQGPSILQACAGKDFGHVLPAELDGRPSHRRVESAPWHNVFTAERLRRGISHPADRHR